MPPVGFEPTISAGERPQTYAVDRAATATGGRLVRLSKRQIVGARCTKNRSFQGYDGIHKSWEDIIN